MARFAMHKAQSAATPNKHPDLTTNKAGGEAFEIRDPSQRMLAMLGSSFWNEPHYYPDAALAAKGKALAANTAPLHDEAATVVQTARAIAASEHPRDLLALALWARTDMNIRTTPQVLLAIAAGEVRTKEFVRRYASRVVQRPDEIRQVFAAYLALYAQGVGANAHGQKLPNSLKRGLADAFGRFSEATLMKYDSTDRPTFRDVLRMVDRGKDRGLPQGVYRYLVTGEVSDPAAMPVIAARKRLATMTTLDDEARELIRTSHANWEVVLSQFGSSKQVWEAVIPEMGYMALLRNLRNFVECDVDLSPVLAKLADPDEVARSRQLPFRFYSAYVTLERDGKLHRPIATALERALDHAVCALPRMPGVTVIASDNSGSMGSPVSAKSTVSLRAVANLMAAIAARLSDEGQVIVFGEKAALVPLSPWPGYMAAMKKQEATDVGHSTNAHEVVNLMLAKGIRADRLIVFSDMQTWNSASSSPATLAGTIATYRARINPKLVVHSVDLAGHGKAAVDSRDERTNLVSGFSEKILNSVVAFEDAIARAASSTPYRETASRPLPTLDDIRARF